jgi:TolB-like protein
MVGSWLLLQITDVVVPILQLPAWAPKLILLIIAIGFIPAIAFAWAFELTPEGIKRESAIHPEQSITHHTAKKLDYVTIALLIAVAGMVGLNRYLPGQHEDSRQAAQESPTAGQAGKDSGEISIAVLPFVNMSADAENEYFSDGISEELLNVLVKVRSLRVASRTSAFSFKGKDTPIPEIARQLEVDHILEGSVRKAGERVRITAQLVDVATDKHLWSETYDRDLTDIFDIQEEISNAIVNALKVALKVEDREAVTRAQHLTDNAEAYELYLRGRFLWRKRGEDNLRAAVQLFEQAIALDPGFPRAHEALAAVWAVMTAWSDQPLAETMALAAESARRALELDPTLSESHAVLAEFAMGQGQFLEMIRHYETALGNEPKNAQTREWYAEVMTNLGFLRKGLQLNREAYDLDPASPIINQGAVWISLLSEDYDRAYRHYQVVRDMFASQPFDPGVVELLSLVGQGELERYVNVYDDGIGRHYMDCIAFAARADDAQSDSAQARQLELLAGNPEAQGFCLIRLGQVDEVIALIEKAIRMDVTAISAFWWPRGQAAILRQPPRFRAILEETGLADFYREYGLPDLCRAVGNSDFSCD